MCAREHREQERFERVQLRAPEHSAGWWARLRAYVRARDGYRCVLCGTSEAELGCALHVDHVYPRRAFPRALDVLLKYGTRGFVSVCPGQHARKRVAEIKWLRGDALALEAYARRVMPGRTDKSAPRLDAG